MGLIGLGAVALGYEQLTSIDTHKKFSSIPAGANAVLLKAEAQTVRWRDDFTPPSSTVGMPMLIADEPFFYTGNLAALDFVAATSGGIVNAAFYKVSL